MKQIPLTQSKVALVDDDIYNYLNQWKWSAINVHNLWYATRHSSRIDDPNGKQHTIFMHHLVIDKPPKGLMTDHKDGNGLNNQRDNLRIVTCKQNNQNKKSYREGRLPGVTLQKMTYKDSEYIYWKAKIKVNGKVKTLGSFKTEQEAHEAYLKEFNHVN